MTNIIYIVTPEFKYLINRIEYILFINLFSNSIFKFDNNKIRISF